MDGKGIVLPAGDQLCARSLCGHPFDEHRAGLATTCQVTHCACWEFRVKPEAGSRVFRPPIVVLCGSIRFRSEFELLNQSLTLAGEIVLSCGVWGQIWYPDTKRRSATEEEKAALDELHKRKIDLADYVYVVDVGGYIGDSTRSEIDYAVARSKEVRYWSRREISGDPLAGDRSRR